MFIRPLSRISKGEKSMTFIVRPRSGITEKENVINLKSVVSVPVGGITKRIKIAFDMDLSSPSPHGDYKAKGTMGRHLV